MNTCPPAWPAKERVVLAHGGGGTLMHRLIEEVFRSRFGSPNSAPAHDGAVLDTPAGRIAFTTDSFVVSPLVFPGGDIGRLAVNGTVNDLAMCGARPLGLSAAFIIEEGLPMATLEQIAESMRVAAAAAGVRLVTGDTKVVERGKADGLFITTAGVGLVPPGVEISPNRVRAGDRVLLNGDIGRHGIAIMAVREGLAFETQLESDTTALSALVQEWIAAGVRLHCLRDATRGGLAGVLVEVTQASGTSLRIDETTIPVRDDVRGACELLGLDPLYVANEGRFAAWVDERDADLALSIMKAHPAGMQGVCIGQTLKHADGRVVLKSAIGADRLLDMLSGEQLPRIC